MQRYGGLTLIVSTVLGLTTPAQAANPVHVQRLLETNQCPNCDLTGAELVDAKVEAKAASIQSEARIGLGSLLRGESAYYLEKGEFTDDIPHLGSWFSPNPTYYHYQGTLIDSGIVLTAQAKQPGLKSYLGVVIAEFSDDEPILLSQLCQSDETTQTIPLLTTLPEQMDDFTCPKGFSVSSSFPSRNSVTVPLYAVPSTPNRPDRSSLDE